MSRRSDDFCGRFFPASTRIHNTCSHFFYSPIGNINNSPARVLFEKLHAPFNLIGNFYRISIFCIRFETQLFQSSFSQFHKTFNINDQRKNLSLVYLIEYPVVFPCPDESGHWQPSTLDVRDRLTAESSLFLINLRG